MNLNPELVIRSLVGQHAQAIERIALLEAQVIALQEELAQATAKSEDLAPPAVPAED